jgi:hypothetical protein
VFGVFATLRMRECVWLVDDVRANSRAYRSSETSNQQAEGGLRGSVQTSRDESFLEKQEQPALKKGPAQCFGAFGDSGRAEEKPR